MPRKANERGSDREKTRLPGHLKDELPKHAQDIYEKALKKAHEEYKNPEKRRSSSSAESTAHKVAWSAVEKEYKRGKDGKWHRKSSTE